MDDPSVKAALYSLGVAIILMSLAGLRGYGSLESKLEYVAGEQVIVRQTLKELAHEINAVQGNRYTDLDGARDMARIDSQMSSIRRALEDQAKMIANNLVAIARYQEKHAQERP